MEPYVKTQFTKAIEICDDKPEYENIKDLMQDMINENVAMLAKDTPTYILKTLHNAAYNGNFTPEFRDCIQSVVFSRPIDDMATTFLVRKLRIMCDTKEDDIKRMDEKVCELEELVNELEMSLERTRVINEQIQTENDRLQQENETLQTKCKGEYGPGDQVDDYRKSNANHADPKPPAMEYISPLQSARQKARVAEFGPNEQFDASCKAKTKVIEEKEDQIYEMNQEIVYCLSIGCYGRASTEKILQHLREKKLYGENENNTRLKQHLYALARTNKIRNDPTLNVWQIVRTDYKGKVISEDEYHRYDGWP